MCTNINEEEQGTDSHMKPMFFASHIHQYNDLILKGFFTGRIRRSEVIERMLYTNPMEKTNITNDSE